MRERGPMHHPARNRPSAERKALGIAIALSLALVGCAARVNKELQPWVGRHQSELIDAWGPPTRLSIDGKGGTVLVYEQSVNYETAGQPLYDKKGKMTGYVPGQQYSSTRYRMFYVDPDGIIYTFR